MRNLKSIVLSIVMIMAITGLLADKVPDFKLEDITGKQVWLSELQDDGLVILDFWATWCVPCKNGLPKMNEIHKKYDKVTVITICTDKPRNKMDAKAFLKSNRFSFVSLFDPQSTVKKMLNVTNIPHSFIVAPDGEIIYEHTGYQRGDEKHYEEVIENWLSQQEIPLEKMVDKKIEIDEENKQDEMENAQDELNPVPEIEDKETEVPQDK